jgi:tellurite resistance protein
MTKTTTQSHHYTDQQISAWLRGLLTIAWADGHFDPEEKELIANLTKDELAPKSDLGQLETISPEELAQVLDDDHDTKENFLRTAVMMAIANGIYSEAEAEILQSFQEALGLEVEALKSLETTLCMMEEKPSDSSVANYLQAPPQHPDVLNPVKKWLDGMEIKDPRVARFICKMIPSQCPFERDVKLFGHKIVHIPAMCQINPLYEQLVGLRFRSLSYLADDCHEDISEYI